ncbi:hypothetical protein D7V97_01550 [Corallococcus sp. CA053C]|uniref:hypothetical protein n=1 Tax=Corallococcus sp. CA053C TaxID=2316732 RepID=UPI000EA07FB9|nr:hypothetical protein [Corallococcus sp. CA053C]RKH14946.1 hypothetical protein D7V97_01550 [Corallococcus sp. CA053C]
MSAVQHGPLGSFYEAAFVGLKALDASVATARRFGPNADARWALFKGELHERDRLDLLIRDAAVNHPTAFAPRRIFLLEGLAEDEPFGPEWPGPDAALAMRLWRDSHAPAPTALKDVLRAAAQAWQLTPQPLASKALTEVAPASRILASGAGAVLALAAHFEGRAELDLADQVLLVTDSPAERQLFGMAVMLLGSTHPAHWVLPTASAEDARAQQFPRSGLMLVSDDVPSARRDAVAVLARALGA